MSDRCYTRNDAAQSYLMECRKGQVIVTAVSSQWNQDAANPSHRDVIRICAVGWHKLTSEE